jgi:hyaluronoglucosaminidase
VADFVHRGVIEGFYGRPYSHADRLWLIEHLGAWGMNRYVYAPKDDQLQRAEWRTPYPRETLAQFAQLIQVGEAAGVSVGFALSPGLSIEYASATDVRTLQRKYHSAYALGARFFCLALDDVPSRLLYASDEARFASLAAAHVALAHAVAEALPDATIWVVPTDYVGVAPTEYLEQLGAELASEIEIGWTGRTVVSPSITAAEAQRRAATLRRRLLVWDNTPVADGSMRPMLHLGPYTGREPALTEHVSGILLNPMKYAHASAVTLRTAADYLRDPEAYDREHSWQHAVGELGADAPTAFEVFAAAHRFSPLLADDRDAELEAALTALTTAQAEQRDPRPALLELRRLVDARLAVADVLRGNLEDRVLASEIEPWLSSHHAETRRAAAAVDLLEVLGPDSTALTHVWAFFRFEEMLARIPPAAVASYGPRRVLYPQLVSLRDDAARFGSEPALFVGRCLVDDLVRLAERTALERLGGAVDQC